MATPYRLSSLKHEPAARKGFFHSAAVGAGTLIFCLVPVVVIAQSEAPIALIPENFSWRRLPNNPARERNDVMDQTKDPP